LHVGFKFDVLTVKCFNVLALNRFSFNSMLNLELST